LQDQGKTIPVTEDVLIIDRKTVELGKVTVSKTVDEHEAVITEPVIHEDVQIERRRVDREVPVDAPPGIRIEGATTVIPVLEEVLVVEKRLMLREEVRITRVRREHPAQQSATLRREQVHVERSAVPSTALKPDEPDSQEQH
jgi:uncharacterized protein (TIGR02271 family)